MQSDEHHSYLPRPNSYKRRHRKRLLLGASKTWIIELVKEVAPCQLCTERSIKATRNRITASYTDGERYAICSRCLGKLAAEREGWQAPYERRLYFPIRTRLERRTTRTKNDEDTNN